jgi:hypothetical protein
MGFYLEKILIANDKKSQLVQNIGMKGGVILRVDFRSLKYVINDPASATTDGKDNSTCISEFTASLTNYIEHNHGLKADELAMVTISIEDWRRKRHHTRFTKDSVNLGDIFYADLGINYKPELAYGHPVVIIEKIRGLYLVLPVSTSQEHMSKAYHPTANPDGVKYLRKVLKSEGEGFTDDSVIIISNLRTISPGRLHDKKGSLKDITNPNSLFNELKNNALSFAFPKYATLINKLEKENKELLDQKEELELKINELNSRIIELEEKQKN